MSYVMVAPEMMTSAATDLATIGSDLSAAHSAAAPATLALTPAAADEVSVGIAHLFTRYAEDYHGLAGRATAFHEQFVQHLTASAGSYASAEAANAASLQHLTASAGSSASAIAALPGQFNSVDDYLNYLFVQWQISGSFGFIGRLIFLLYLPVYLVGLLQLIFLTL